MGEEMSLMQIVNVAQRTIYNWHWMIIIAHHNTLYSGELKKGQDISLGDNLQEMSDLIFWEKNVIYCRECTYNIYGKYPKKFKH